MQSNDYKPGVSGWKIDNGTLYLNRATIQVGALPAEPQLITVEASSWPESGFPIGALEQLKFIQGEIEAIPEQWRGSAEVSTQDESLDRDGSDIRTTLTYKRLETAAEADARHAKIAKAGKRMELSGGGWELYDERGVLRARFGPSFDDESAGRAQTDEAAAEQAAAVANAATAGTHGATESPHSAYVIKIKVNEVGQYIAAGIGIHQDEHWSAQIATVDQLRAEEIRQVIADQLRPGGMLHRR